MDADRFDNFLRSLSRTPSRRATLRLLVGAAIGGLVTSLLGWQSLEDATAHDTTKKCKKIADKSKRKKCLKKAKQHNASHSGGGNGQGTSQDGATPLPFCATQANGTPCNAGGTNQCCGGVCVDTATDEAHCGACNDPCSALASTCCAGNCVNTSLNSAHCGGCGNACLPDEDCDGANLCCERIYTTCDPGNDRCCGDSTCTGFLNSGQQVCCGITGISSCAPGCGFNALCRACCASHCGSDLRCAPCVTPGGACPFGCLANGECAACCSGRCGANSQCCKLAGAKCEAGSECCSGICQDGGVSFDTCA